MFKTFSLPYLLRIASEGFSYPSPRVLYIFDLTSPPPVKRKLRDSGLGDDALPPMIVFPKGGHFAIEMLSGPESQYDALSLDWTIEPSEARRRVAQAAEREIEVNGARVKRDRPITLQVRDISSATRFGECLTISNKPG